MRKYPPLQVFFIIFIFLLFGCEERFIREPAKVKVEFDLVSTSFLGSNAQVQNLDLHLDKMQIQGVRLNAEDVFFTKDLSEEEIFRITFRPSIDIDLPAGTYERLEFITELRPDLEEEEDIDEDIEELLEEISLGELEEEEILESYGDIVEKYLTDSENALLLTARYIANNRNLTIVFVINTNYLFRTLYRTTSGGTQFNLEEGKFYTANLSFDLNRAFENISNSLIQSAQVGLYDDGEYVLLHRKINSELYLSVLNRLESSLKLEIVTP